MQCNSLDLESLANGLRLQAAELSLLGLSYRGLHVCDQIPADFSDDAELMLPGDHVHVQIKHAGPEGIVLRVTKFPSPVLLFCK